MTSLSLFSCTVRAKITETNFDYIKFYKTINAKFQNLRGIQTSNAGKYVELCFETPDDAELAESVGLDFEEKHYNLYPLGQRYTFVSTFVPIQFHDEDLLTLLERYGPVKSVRRLYHKVQELSHLENGCRVVTFTKLNKPLPKRISYGGISIGFKYTGQPKSCVRCSSFEHEINECPRGRFRKQIFKENETEPKPENRKNNKQQLKTLTLNPNLNQNLNQKQQEKQKCALILNL